MHLKRFNLTCLLFTENYSSFNREGLHDNSNNKKNIATHMEVKNSKRHIAPDYFLCISRTTQKNCMNDQPAKKKKKKKK